MRELTLGADADAAAVPPSPPAAPDAEAASPPVLLLVFDPKLLVVVSLFLFRFPLLEVVVGVDGGGGKF